MKKERSVLVIGAGFSGLSAAHYLERAGYRVEVREKTERVGGLIRSSPTEYGLIESAANGILNSPLVEDLFTAANVEMIPTLREARSRYIVRGGQLRRWPLSIFESLGMLKFIFYLIFRKASVSPRPAESVEAWGSRVFSPSASRFTIETALQGIYAGDPKKLSATRILGRFFFNRYKSQRKLKFRGTVSARNGMEDLLSGLRRSLESRGVKFSMNMSATGENLVTERRSIVIATGAKDAAELLSAVDPLRSAAVAQVQVLPIVSVAVVYPGGSFPHRGFGYLFPPGSAKILGVLMNNWIFANRVKGHVLSETWILGGALAEPGLIDRSDQEILNLIDTERTDLTGTQHKAIASRVQRWPHALPHVTIELEKLGPVIGKDQKNIFLLGNYTGGIGLAKILEQAAELPARINDV